MRYKVTSSLVFLYRIHVYVVQMWENSAECERVCRYENLDLANQARVGVGGWGVDMYFHDIQTLRL